ncbi:hypothetical protein R2R35_06715 [Anaerocolumna sp. AGMB13020]|uniref:hypothetical protein n=1 Tax=Anaerocolumna sp. AGMB13020 TaxID=3081750 RepID=UPI0029556998|nr:hypothetical protein [Anaerocolumna sp. AGMB13020]WOO38189.1 hypothetical protein R2R35_06715 [Anaerocolumna sp. AGMB13020]
MYLFSKLSDTDLRELYGINGIGKMFELLGIYYSCQDRDNYEIFLTIYDEEAGKTDHHYRNIGEKHIKKILECRKVEIPRHIFRVFSETWVKVPVITHTDMAIIFDALLERIHSNEILWRIAKERIFTEEELERLMNMLYFQYANVVKYLDGSVTRKQKIFKDLLDKWRNNNIISYID